MDTTMEHLEWDVVAASVKPIINIWVDGSELRWAQYAWDTLAAAGLTSYSSEPERAQCLPRAVALGALCRDFSARAFDEGSPGDWSERVGAEDLVGPYPLMSAFTLGQLAERGSIEIDDAPFDDGDGIAAALRELVGAQYPIVWHELRTHNGDADLFAALFASSSEDASYPLTGEQVSAIVNDNVTGNKMMAWEWLTEGSTFAP